MTRPIVVLTIALSLCACVAQKAVWQADLAVPGVAVPYHEAEGTVIEPGEEAGAPLLNVTTSGEQALEGPCLYMGPGMEGGRRCMVRFEVRGAGVSGRCSTRATGGSTRIRPSSLPATGRRAG